MTEPRYEFVKMDVDKIYIMGWDGGRYGILHHFGDDIWSIEITDHYMQISGLEAAKGRAIAALDALQSVLQAIE